MLHKLMPVAVAGALILMSCGSRDDAVKTTSARSWGKTAEGEDVTLYTLRNAGGVETTITNYGGRVVTLLVPDRTGQKADVVLGFDSLDGYLKENPFFGALAGRYGNRIGKGKFSLNGMDYTLAKNNGENSLHGGIRGFDKKVWKASQDGQKLELTYISRDGEEGFPGTMTTVVTYTLTDKNELRIDYAISTDKDTVKNVTNHSYFNLAGQGEGDILGHQVTLSADRYTPVDSGLIPTGELAPVTGTPFDFRQPHAIGERIDAAGDQQIKFGKGYDHNFVLNGEMGTPHDVAKITEPKSGRVMDVSTTEPGVQFYTGNFLDGTLTGKGGKVYKHRFGFCLETQHFPDSPNKPAFPTTVLKPGERYQSTTIYRFSTDAAK